MKQAIRCSDIKERQARRNSEEPSKLWQLVQVSVGAVVILIGLVTIPYIPYVLVALAEIAGIKG